MDMLDRAVDVELVCFFFDQPGAVAKLLSINLEGGGRWMKQVRTEPPAAVSAPTTDSCNR